MLQLTYWIHNNVICWWILNQKSQLKRKIDTFVADRLLYLPFSLYWETTFDAQDQIWEKLFFFFLNYESQIPQPSGSVIQLDWRLGVLIKKTPQLFKILLKTITSVLCMRDSFCAPPLPSLIVSCWQQNTELVQLGMTLTFLVFNQDLIIKPVIVVWHLRLAH